ncbi:hypothetical protein TrRE_jg6722, partial [Triparma retinervis]
MYNNATKLRDLNDYFKIALARSIFDAISQEAMYAPDNALIQGKYVLVSKVFFGNLPNMTARTYYRRSKVGKAIVGTHGFAESVYDILLSPSVINSTIAGVPIQLLDRHFEDMVERVKDGAVGRDSFGDDTGLALWNLSCVDQPGQFRNFLEAIQTLETLKISLEVHAADTEDGKVVLEMVDGLAETFINIVNPSSTPALPAPAPAPAPAPKKKKAATKDSGATEKKAKKKTPRVTVASLAQAFAAKAEGINEEIVSLKVAAENLDSLVNSTTSSFQEAVRDLDNKQHVLGSKQTALAVKVDSLSKGSSRSGSPALGTTLAVPRSQISSTSAVPRSQTSTTAVPRSQTSTTAVPRSQTSTTAVPRSQTSTTAVPRSQTSSTSAVPRPQTSTTTAVPRPQTSTTTAVPRPQTSTTTAVPRPQTPFNNPAEGGTLMDGPPPTAGTLMAGPAPTATTTAGPAPTAGTLTAGPPPTAGTLMAGPAPTAGTLMAGPAPTASTLTADQRAQIANKKELASLKRQAKAKGMTLADYQT